MKIHTEIQQPCPECGSGYLLGTKYAKCPFFNLLPSPELMRFGGSHRSQATVDFYSGDKSVAT